MSGVKHTSSENFLWGSATSSYQVEGGIENCDWAKAARAGKVPVCGAAADHYHRFEEDFDLAQDLGHNAHRLSVEWARIEPEEGQFDEREIEHYRQVLRALKARGFTPMVTLWHFTLPLWFSERGGFEHKEAPEIFARYCAYVVSKLGDECEHFDTINEPLVVTGIGYIRGSWPPFHTKDYIGYVRVLRALIRCHNRAYRTIKEQRPTVTVGLVKHTIWFAANGNPFNKLRAGISNWFWTHRFMRGVRGHLDAVGVNYYRHHIYGDTQTYEKTDIGWNIYPEGLYGALKLLAPYHKPLYVTEAGLADAEDMHRADYIRESVEAVDRAQAEGLDVRGFFYWSLLDNYEWAEGFTMRFGLIEVDFDTLERRVRPSAYVYRQLIKQHQHTRQPQ